ncbi:MAG: YbjQ family protein [Arcticibacter sp.]
MSNLITTTTSNLEGWTITNYLQPVSSNIVVGANIFSDFSASITDFFGGRSGTYEKKLQQIYEQSIQKLQKKAKAMGASAIVGLKIDIDEITGKGTQMFMVTAYGTPVRAIRQRNEVSTNDSAIEKVMDGTYVENKVIAKRIIERSEINKRLDLNDLNFILEHPYPEFVDTMIDYTRRNASNATGPEDETVAMQIRSYFSNIDPNTAAEVLYVELLKADYGVKYQYSIRDAIKELCLIDYDKLADIMKSGNLQQGKFALNILAAKRESYTEADKIGLARMKDIIDESFQPLGTVTSKKGFMSGEKSVWVCTCKRSNDLDAKYCAGCLNDIYGFKQGESHPVGLSKLIEDRLSFI